MKHTLWILVCGMGAAPLLTSCTTTSRSQPDVSRDAPDVSESSDGKTVQTADDDLDEYAVAEIADPLEPLNRATFALNDGIYTVLLRPIARGYEKVLPSPVRRGVKNVFDNVKFPVRLANNLLQANFPRAGRETGKFLVNSTLGIAGIFRPSDKFPALADVPQADTGQTLAKWGIGHGCYLVLPVLGPSSVRETFGLAGDTALNPVSWVGFWYAGAFFAGPDWTIAIGSTHTLRALPDHMDAYDAATENALEKYLAIRSAWAQHRNAVASQ